MKITRNIMTVLFLVASLLSNASWALADDSDEGSDISAPRSAGFFDFMKGCVWMGGIGAGATSLATTMSGAKAVDSKALAVSALTSCLIGGFIVSDVYKAASVKASIELQAKNQKLKREVWNLQHSLCVMKRKCGPDGIPYEEKRRAREKLRQQNREAYESAGADVEIGDQELRKGDYSEEDSDTEEPGLIRLKTGN